MTTPRKSQGSFWLWRTPRRFLSDTHAELEGEGQNTMTEVDDEDENNLAFDNIVGSDVSYTSFALRMNYNIPIMSAAQFIIGVGAVQSNYAAESSITSVRRAFQLQLRCQRSGWYRVANRALQSVLTELRTITRTQRTSTWPVVPG